METVSEIKVQSWLVWFMRGIVFFGLMILLARVFILQVIKGSYYKALADENRIRRVPISAPRGRIIARGGEILAGNIEEEKKVDLENNDFQKTSRINPDNPEEIFKEYRRIYFLGSSFGHASGYLGEINKEELGKISGECSEKGPRIIKDDVGRSGLEEIYDCQLRGINGEEMIEVDSMGRGIRILGRKNPIRGDDLKTNIDFGLQKKISEIVNENKFKLKYSKAAVVASDIQGEVLAIYSLPSFDPNIFVDKSNQTEKIEEVLNDPSLPLFNRVIAGIYHPGSVFKPFVAIAGLSEGVIDENYIYKDEGVITVKSIYGEYSYSNWFFNQYGGREGEIKIDRAIARSTDTFFYNLGELVGVENIDKWADIFNLNKKTDIDLTSEVSGLVPSPSWKEEVKGERWYLGNTYHLSIGQGDIALTPLGINSAVAAIVGGGKYCYPKVAEVDTTCNNLGIDEKVINIIKKGMNMSCNSGGTGFTFFDFKEKSGIDVGCKTGTAEISTEGKKTHAWFTVFAPLKDPEIVLTVMVEEGGEGSKVAGPIAREIMDFWFKSKSESESASY